MNEALQKLFRNSSARQQETMGFRTEDPQDDTIRMGMEAHVQRTKYSAQEELHRLLPTNTPEVIGIDARTGHRILEHVQGKTLLEVAQEDSEQAYYYLERLKTLIAHLHQNGFVHGDLNMANIIIKKRTCELYIVDPASWDFNAQTDLDSLSRIEDDLHKATQK